MKILNKYVYVILLAVCPTYIMAGLPDSYGFSARGIGRAGTFVADVDDWSAAFFNMAGMTAPKTKSHYKLVEQAKEAYALNEDGTFKSSLKDRMNATFAPPSFLETGFCYIYQISKANISPDKTNATIRNNIDIGTKDLSYGLIEFGLNVDLRAIIKTPLNVPIRFGMVMSLRDNGTLVSINDTNPTEYAFFKLGKEPQTVTAIMGVSTQLWKDYISIGGGVGIGVAGKGGFSIKDVSISINNDQNLSHEIRTDITPLLSPNAGIMFAIPLIVIDDYIRIGLNYKRETLLDLKPLNVQASTNLLSLELPITLAILDFYVPDLYTAGISYTGANSKMIFTVAGEAEYQRWSGFHVSVSKQAYYAQKAISLPKFNDIIIYKGTFEFKPRAIPTQFRIGYSFVPTFIPDQSGATNFLDNSKNVFSAGITIFFANGKFFKPKSKMSIGVQYLMGKERRSSKDPALTSSDLNPSYAYNVNTTILSIDFGMLF